jgi:rod shape-determining protein MreC
MNKLVFLLILLLITVVYIFKKDRLLSDNYPIINDIKALYIEKAIDLESVIQKYFQQTRTIETLKTQNQALIQYQSLYQSTKSTLESLKQTLPNIHQTVENIQLSKVISYVELNDFTKVWLDLKKENMQIEVLHKVYSMAMKSATMLFL